LAIAFGEGSHNGSEGKVASGAFPVLRWKNEKEPKMWWLVPFVTEPFQHVPGTDGTFNIFIYLLQNIHKKKNTNKEPIIQ